MPRRRHKRKRKLDEVEVVELHDDEVEEGLPAEEQSATTEEQPAVFAESEEEWPDWAYSDRPRRAGRSRRQRRRDRKRQERQRAAAAPTETDEEPATSFFDQSESADEEAEPAVWVDDAPPLDEAPLWRSDEEERLRELPEEESDREPEVAVVGEAEEEEPGFGVLPPHDLEISGEGDSDQEDEYRDDDDSDDDYDDEADHYPDEERGYQPVIGDVVPGHVGTRRAALHERKRKERRIASLILIGLGVALVIGLTSLTGGSDDGDDDDDNDSQVAVANNQDSVESMLLFGTREANEAVGAVWLALLSIDRDNNQGSVVYIPAHTAVEVPGRGLLPLGEAGAVDVPLLLVSTESLLGTQIDHYLELSDKDAQVLFGNFGTVDVDVPSEVSVPAGTGQTRLVFTEGTQTLEGEQLAQLLYIVGIEGDDVELGSRHLAFWDALFETFGARSEELEQNIVDAAAVVGESDASPEDNADFLGDLASLPEDSMVLNALPVQQVSVGEGELYGVEDDQIQQFIRDTTGARSFAGDETRVQVLNGVGVPGIGDDVAGTLASEPFKVAYSGNARRFDYEKTLIITYERSDEGIALARRAKELLGVGEVQVSAQDQGIVDLTIVVGKDFLERT